MRSSQDGFLKHVKGTGPYALVLVLSTLVFSQSEDLNRTGGFSNGGLWAGLSANSKAHFTVGFSEGIRSSGAIAPALATAYPGTEMTVRESLDGVDQFYKEPANSRIQIRAAMRIFALKAAGASAAKLETETVALRADPAKER